MLLIIALLLLAWGMFAAAVVIMMVYGIFADIALNEPVMAAILAAGTAFLAALGFLIAWLQARRRSAK
ncbi:hypothetical protein ACFOGJ_17675 [Marinibaculum pumilum]|uniref:Uncharacterized protein n=1 Tax=Marinibaculum pumilum TaxID=1766165 RepID=A0ABV7L3X3_9PROT